MLVEISKYFHLMNMSFTTANSARPDVISYYATFHFLYCVLTSNFDMLDMIWLKHKTNLHSWLCVVVMLVISILSKGSKENEDDQNKGGCVAHEL